MAIDRPKLALVSSHGGHLTELLELSLAFEGCDVFYFCYDADTTRRLPNAYLTPNRPYSPLQFLRNLVRLHAIFRNERPDLLLSTGAEIAIPAFLVAKLLHVPTIYIECGAQVTRPSVTGRLLVNLADRFYVQWPELVGAYKGRANYAGSLVDETPVATPPPEQDPMRETGT
jgi:UDP-N-acetylglucosamine:LPS N-acetylglucosamine transferase